MTWLTWGVLIFAVVFGIAAVRYAARSSMNRLPRY